MKNDWVQISVLIPPASIVEVWVVVSVEMGVQQPQHAGVGGGEEVGDAHHVSHVRLHIF